MEFSAHTISDNDIKNIQRNVRHWGIKNFVDFPWRQPATEWHGLLAEVLLQRTKAQAVVPVYNEFVGKYPTPEDLVDIDIKEIEQAIFSLGLPQRAYWIKELATVVARLGEIPRNLECLLQLPGVGPYIASAWLSFHGGKRAVIVDANVVRWLCRMIDAPFDGETRRKRWLLELADKFTPQRAYKSYNYAVLDLTILVCMPRKPKCFLCPLKTRYCKYSQKNLFD